MAGAAPRSTKKLLLLALAALLALAVLVVLGREVGDVLPRFTAWVQGLGVWGPVAYIAGYVVATVVFAPGVVLTLASGVIFGLLWGTVYTLIGASIGAACAFLVARYLARRFVERRLAARPRFQAIDRAVGHQGFKIVVLMRLSPVFPYNLLNYALGLTRVRFADYLLASVGMIPGTLLYVYYGKALGSLAAVASGAEVQKGTEFWLFLGLGLAATIAVTTYITRIAGRALRQEIDR
ncbi:MAG TPA: TVP38/TMEM64 family protein [Thermoanaerobaculia bacterium]|nr:TVP38/TMEM64 family protein [Thermoanaerobaculia bacterium]